MAEEKNDLCRRNPANSPCPLALTNLTSLYHLQLQPRREQLHTPAMSLDPRESQRRGRSRSPGGRERERSSTRVDAEWDRERVVRAPSPPTSRYDDDPRGRDYDYDEPLESRPRDRRQKADVIAAEPRERGYEHQYRSSSPAPGSRADPYAVPGGFEDREEVKVAYSRKDSKDDRGAREKDYYSVSRREEYERPEHERSRYSVSGRHDDYEPAERDPRDKDPRDRDPRDRDPKDRDPRDRDPRDRDPRDRDPRDRDPRDRDPRDDHRRYEDDDDRRPSYAKPPSPDSKYGRDGHRPSYAEPSSPESKYAKPPSPKLITYAEPKQWEYAKPEGNITYTRHPVTDVVTRTASPPRAYVSSSGRSRQKSTTEYRVDSARSSKSTVVTVEPGSRSKRRDSSPVVEIRKRDTSPGPGLLPRTHSLSVGTGHYGSASLSLANAPGSPLQEAYHGTYQSISPMPSPLMIAATPHMDMNIIEAISPVTSGDEGDGLSSKKHRRARFHDPEEEATMLARALKGDKRSPDTGPLIDVLPGLTHDQVLELRVQYKKIVKTGSDKKGVNIAKHVKMRLKEEDPGLMKACYACALGKWESEAYWANFWYQGEKSRRELLIESLMGRTAAEIREIKDAFRDKKYHDSLTKCMKMELKEDKFKKAVLLVLEEKKVDERPGYRVDRYLVAEDVEDLHKAVRAEKGGETAMISIVVVRSDSHLREVLRLYEETYKSNFAREMLKKSGNLVVRPPVGLPS